MWRFKSLGIRFSLFEYKQVLRKLNYKKIAASHDDGKKLPLQKHACLQPAQDGSFTYYVESLRFLAWSLRSVPCNGCNPT